LTSGHGLAYCNTDLSAQRARPASELDAAWKTQLYLEPNNGDLLPGQATDPAAWRESVGRVHALRPDRVHFCHDADVVHS
jgi:hypothetical protein